MEPFLGPTEIKQKEPETVAEILTRMDGRAAKDTTILDRIAKNTSGLAGLKGSAVSTEHIATATTGRIRKHGHLDRSAPTPDGPQEVTALARPVRHSITPSSEATAIAYPIKGRDLRGRFENPSNQVKPGEPRHAATLAGIAGTHARKVVSAHSSTMKEV